MEEFCEYEWKRFHAATWEILRCSRTIEKQILAGAGMTAVLVLAGSDRNAAIENSSPNA